MPFQRRRPQLVLNKKHREMLVRVSRSRTEAVQRVERARILLAYADGETVSAIARTEATNRPKVERAIDKALQMGPLVALRDLQRSGRSRKITEEARAWVVSLACQKPREFGYSYELWTCDLLSRHIRNNCKQKMHHCLEKVSKGTISKILSRHKLKPHKIRYYIERRDPNFDAKMIDVLHVYKEVSLVREKSEESRKDCMTAYISYDEKPGIQAIGVTAPDLPPKPDVYPSIAREGEYERFGTLSLLAGIDLLSGHVHGLVLERHRSREFIEFLRKVDDFYPKEMRIRVVLDNHSAHTSKETRAFLTTVPNRFEFIFTPTHGSWLNLIECFFSKMARSMLRGIRVSSKDDLKQRILLYLDEVNELPVVFRWKYRLDEISIA